MADVLWMVYRNPKRGKAEALRVVACFVNAPSGAAAKRKATPLLADKLTQGDYTAAQALQVHTDSEYYL